ncbi:cytochrome c [Pelovirga terrestris]|uniref:C-type cytochrome n=1 Tax=Pelovirga terrestris TaxID=2771352 RepID=A0A8J6QUR4_9BACT|nr:c-type cytochrome [Pelovirga terrestris]MBD1400640.1 c-type cytochrome [Pelovirga terrestris]
MSEKKRDKHDEHADGIVEDRKQAPPLYFYILFYGLIIWGIGFSAYYLFSGWSSEKEFEEKMAGYQETYTQPNAAAQTSGQTATAEAAAAASGINAVSLYNSNCAACHGAGGAGGFATDLTGDYAYGKDADSIRTSIAQGRGAMMPGFTDSLSSNEIDALVAYLLKL